MCSSSSARARTHRHSLRMRDDGGRINDMAGLVRACATGELGCDAPLPPSAVILHPFRDPHTLVKTAPTVLQARKTGGCFLDLQMPLWHLPALTGYP